MVYFSKHYTTANNINAGATSNENFISEIDQYESGCFDQILIINKDSVNLRINLDKNQDNGIICLANSQIGGSQLAFKEFSVSNVSSAGTHTAGTVFITVENTRFPRRL